MPSFHLNGESITLAQALKASGQVGSGGEAKALVRSGEVRVNGDVETRPGRKLVAGDRIGVRQGEEWVLMPGG